MWARQESVADLVAVIEPFLGEMLWRDQLVAVTRASSAVSAA